MKQRIAHPVGLPSPSAYAHIVNATGGGASMCMPSRSMGSVRRRTRGGGELHRCTLGRNGFRIA